MSAVLALCSSLLWGVADFLGGTASRRRTALAVVAGSQAIAFLLLAVVVVATTAWDGSAAYLPYGLVGGVFSLVGLVAFYAALAGGTMGVVAPVSALSVLVPAAVGAAQGERPSGLQVAGTVVAVVGVVLASGPEVRGRASRRSVLLALVAAVSFGTVSVMLAEGGESSVPMTLFVMRVVSLGLLAGLFAGVATARGGAARLERGDLALLAAIGAADVLANATYSLAARSGLLTVVGVLGSLYPAVTVVLARIVHGERMRRVQDAGIVGALGGVALIAAGGGAG